MGSEASECPRMHGRRDRARTAGAEELTGWTLAAGKLTF